MRAERSMDYLKDSIFLSHVTEYFKPSPLSLLMICMYCHLVDIY